MENIKTDQQNQSPAFPVKVNGITYMVAVHFREASGETFEQKIKRMLRNEVTQNPL